MQQSNFDKSNTGAKSSDRDDLPTGESKISPSLTFFSLLTLGQYLNLFNLFLLK